MQKQKQTFGSMCPFEREKRANGKMKVMAEKRKDSGLAGCMDLATFFASTNPYAIERRLEEDIFRSSRPVLPPSTSTERGMAHVDAYVKAFYFPEQDMQKWINANYTSYQKRHLLGLICCVAASNGWRPSEVDNLTSKVEELYND